MGKEDVKFIATLSELKDCIDKIVNHALDIVSQQNSRKWCELGYRDLSDFINLYDFNRYFKIIYNELKAQKNIEIGPHSVLGPDVFYIRTKVKRRSTKKAYLGAKIEDASARSAESQNSVKSQVKESTPER